MNPLEFQARTRLVIESGGRSRIGELLAQRHSGRVLIVTDPGVRQAGILDDVRVSLAVAGIRYDEYADLRPNPRIDECDELARRYRGLGIGTVLAVGGGSAIDVAKAASLLLTHAGSAADYAHGQPCSAPLLPVACIPTTAGTGSEVTPYAVLSDPARRRKLCLADPALVPELAILDEAVLATLPAATLASTGLDALTHAIEAYTCRRASPLADALALHAIRLIATTLEPVVAGAGATERQSLLVASTMAGMAFGNADVAAVHCLSEALGGHYDWQHGVCNAIMLPLVFRHNSVADPVRHAAVAHALGIPTQLAPAAAAAAAADALALLATRLRIPRLAQLPGANAGDIESLATAAKANISDPSNAREMSAASYAALLAEAFSA